MRSELKEMNGEMHGVPLAAVLQTKICKQNDENVERQGSTHFTCSRKVFMLRQNHHQRAEFIICDASCKHEKQT